LKSIGFRAVKAVPKRHREAPKPAASSASRSREPREPCTAEILKRDCKLRAEPFVVELQVDAELSDCERVFIRWLVRKVLESTR
jgi:hypothetical protein